MVSHDTDELANVGDDCELFCYTLRVLNNIQSNMKKISTAMRSRLACEQGLKLLYLLIRRLS
jgi:hypothetical protein